MRKGFLRLLPMGIFIVLAIFLWRGLSSNPNALPSMRLGKTIPDFDLPRLNDKAHSRFSSHEMLGHVVILNVWASWCEACREEQVFLLKLAHQGMPIYGLNYNDTPSLALQWLRTWGNPYLAIGADQTGEAAMNLGVYGTPETFLLDQRGVVQFRYAGVLDDAVWQKEFLPRIQQLEAKG